MGWQRSVGFLAAFLSLVIAQQELPGLNFLGVGINSLTYDPQDPQHFGQIYQLTWNQNLTTSDGKYRIPDNTEAKEYPVCIFQNTTNLIKSSFDYYEYISVQETEYSDFLFWSSSQSESYYYYTSVTTSTTNYVELSSAECTSFSMGFQPYVPLLLSQSFIQAVEQLPTTFDSSNSIWLSFINVWGTDVLIAAITGGILFENALVNAYNYQQMVSSGTDVETQASIGFAVDAGFDVYGANQTSEYKSYSTLSTNEGLYCLGGTSSACNFATWSPTVPSNPIPLQLTLDSLPMLLTPANFPQDPNIALRAQALTSALNWYFQTYQNVPLLYAADYAEENGNTPPHSTSISHNLGVVPTFIEVHFTSVPNTTTSEFFPIQFAYEQDYSGSPGQIEISQNEIIMHIAWFVILYGAYDASTTKWTSYEQGYWVATASKLKPALGGVWQKVAESASNQQITLASGLTLSEITLLQVQYGEDTDPVTAYPLTSRCVPLGEVNIRNPVSITLENGVLALQFQPGAIFSVFNNRVWTDYNSGAFRGNVFTLKPDFDSGWVVSPTTQQIFSFVHNLNIVPLTVQIFFSPNNGTTLVYPVLWNYNPENGVNPLGIQVDRHTVALSLYRDSGNMVLWEVFHASTGLWTKYTSGYWRVTAWKTFPTS